VLALLLKQNSNNACNMECCLCPKYCDGVRGDMIAVWDYFQEIMTNFWDIPRAQRRVYDAVRCWIYLLSTNAFGASELGNHI